MKDAAILGIQLICMAGCKLLPFGIHIGGVISQFIVLEGTLSEAKLLHKLALLVVGEYLLQLFFGHHIAFEFELKYFLIFSTDCFRWVWTVWRLTFSASATSWQVISRRERLFCK